MTRRTYHIEPQRAERSCGYVPCAPHAASRVSVIETTFVPAKAGRRAYQIKKVVENFYGPQAFKRAQQCCDGKTSKRGGRPATKPGIWGRSLTINEYDEVMNRRRMEGSF